MDTVQSAAEESVKHLKEAAKDAAQSVTARAKKRPRTSRLREQAAAEVKDSAGTAQANIQTSS